MDKLEKDYIYINTKELLLKHINNGTLDMYYADNSHWSPIAAQIVTKEILKRLELD